MENNSLDEEYRRLLRRGDEEERERLRAEREAHEPESEPEPVLREPTDEEPITVAAAAWLLHARYIRPLESKPDDSAIHRELRRNHKSLERRELEELILRWGREGLIDLIDPILEIPIARSPDPHRYWLIGPKAFETLRNKLANAHEPAVLPEPAVIDATVPPNEIVVDSRPLRSEKRMRFVEWGEAEQKQSGSYPPMQPNKRGRDDVRTWAARSGVSRKDAEEWAREAGWARKRGQRICK